MIINQNLLNNMNMINQIGNNQFNFNMNIMNNNYNMNKINNMNNFNNMNNMNNFNNFPMYMMNNNMYNNNIIHNNNMLNNNNMLMMNLNINNIKKMIHNNTYNNIGHNQMNILNNINQNPNINKNHNKKLNQIIGIESVIPKNVVSEKIINNKEYDIITQICVEAIKENKEDISLYCTEKIIKKLKGQWFVLIQNLTDDNFEFNFSKINFKDILIFQYRDKIVYVSPLK